MVFSGHVLAAGLASQVLDELCDVVAGGPGDAVHVHMQLASSGDSAGLLGE
jgi:hypothetical protein